MIFTKFCLKKQISFKQPIHRIRQNEITFIVGQNMTEIFYFQIYYIDFSSISINQIIYIVRRFIISDFIDCIIFAQQLFF